MAEFNIIIGDPPERDVEVLLQPWEPTGLQWPDQNNDITRLPKECRWPQLLKAIKAFPSTSQARKNGWDKDIPEGWSEVKVGRRFIYVLKNTGEKDEHREEGKEQTDLQSQQLHERNDNPLQ